jgi:hypothetical protein
LATTVNVELRGSSIRCRDWNDWHSDDFPREIVRPTNTDLNLISPGV